MDTIIKQREIKVDKLLKRKWQHVKAIATYNNQFKVISSLEMEKIAIYKNVVGSSGDGPPRVAIDLKENEKRGLEVDIVFYGKRNEEKMDINEIKDWRTFGHIVLSPAQALEFASKLIEVVAGLIK